MDNSKKIPTTGYARLSQIIGNKKAKPPIVPIIPVSKSTWYEGVRTGRYPKPFKHGQKVSLYRWAQISELCESIEEQESSK
jgi:predicted DNA-binding transcriptional regulator AlpA